MRYEPGMRMVILATLAADGILRMPPTGDFNVIAHGAVGDGTRPGTEARQEAIDEGRS